LKPTTVILATIVMLLISAPALLLADSVPMPFQTGEKLTFQLRWAFVPAGEAVLEVLPCVTLNGTKVRHFALTVKTNSFIDTFYKVRDRIDAYTDMDMTRSVLYRKRQLEGKTNRDVQVSFDWNKCEAQYTNHGKSRAPISLMPGSMDPLSAFYVTRLLDLNQSSMVERPVTDGKKNVMGRARVVKKETISVPWGAFDTVVMSPDLDHVGGVFEKSRNAKIELWLTADHRRIPVKIRSKVVVGSFVGELVSVSRPLITTRYALK
jgi:hypothetical protein